MHLKKCKKRRKKKENQQHRVFTPTSEKQGKKKINFRVFNMRHYLYNAPTYRPTEGTAVGRLCAQSGVWSSIAPPRGQKTERQSGRGHRTTEAEDK